MVIEQFRDPRAVHQRFVQQGRLLSDGVKYVVSWIDPGRHRCFQLMDVQDTDALQQWITRWADLVDFEVVPVIESSTYWETMPQGDTHVDHIG